MNRRGFLATSAAFFAGLRMPALVPPGHPTKVYPWGKSIVSMIREHQVALNGHYYIALAHPSVETDLRELAAREAWTHAWRAYRVARQENLCGYLAPGEVLRRFAPRPDPATVEVGRWQGIRFVESGGPA
jgi:hypothetical protein